MDGKGEDPAMQALLSPDFATMSNKEALTIAMAVQELVRGQASLASNMESVTSSLTAVSDLVEKLQERMERMDKAEVAWQTDREKFFQTVSDRAESLRIRDPEEKTKFQVTQGNQIQQLMLQATIKRKEANQKFEELLKTEPEVTIVPVGHVENRDNGMGKSVPTLVSDIVRIKSHTWVLPPGVSVKVPKIVAEAYREKLLARQEGQERANAFLLNGTPSDGGIQHEAYVVRKKILEIDSKYKTSSAYSASPA